MPAPYSEDLRVRIEPEKRGKAQQLPWQSADLHLRQEEFAMRYFSDGRIELDTGPRRTPNPRTCHGRKNYLFCGSAGAARRLTGVYALVCSCQNLGIHTRTYLTDVITRLQAAHPLRQIDPLRPDIWAIERGTLTTDKWLYKSPRRLVVGTALSMLAV